jgi:phage gpG-like protein
MISVQVDNVNGVIASFKGYEREAAKAVKRAVDITAMELQADAKKILNSHLQTFQTKGTKWKYKKGEYKRTGTAVRSIQVQKTNTGELSSDLGPLDAAVGSNLKYAPYWEFGIGDFVDIMPGWEDIAIQFKGKKKVHGFRGASFLGKATVNQAKKFMERVYNELAKIKMG